MIHNKDKKRQKPQGHYSHSLPHNVITIRREKSLICSMRIAGVKYKLVYMKDNVPAQQ